MMTDYRRSDSLMTCFGVQMRVIWALMMRELHTRFGRENIGFLWFIGEPILFCAGVAIVWTAIRPSHEHGLPMTAIVITGYVPLTMWRHCMSRAVMAFEANGSLLFHRQVTPLDIILARSIIEILGAIGAGFLVYLGAMLLGYIQPPKDIGLLYLGLLFQSLFSLATALIVAPLTQQNEILEKAMTIMSYLSLPLSGAFSMVDWIPQPYQWILMASPSVEAIEMIRGGQFGLSAHAHYDVVYSLWINLLLILIGLSLTMRVRKYIQVQ